MFPAPIRAIFFLAILLFPFSSEPRLSAALVCQCLRAGERRAVSVADAAGRLARPLRRRRQTDRPAGGYVTFPPLLASLRHRPRPDTPDAGRDTPAPAAASSDTSPGSDPPGDTLGGRALRVPFRRHIDALHR